MSRAIAQVIIAAGLTEEQADKIVELGAESEVELKELTEEDLIGLGVPKLKARAALRAWGAFAAISSTPPEFTVRIDPGDRKVAEIDEPAELLAIVVSAKCSDSDRKAAAKKLSGMGRMVVVDKSDLKKVRVDDTTSFWKFAAPGTCFWGIESHPVVDPTTVFQMNEKVEIDPFELGRNRSLVALVNGVNHNSGVDWTRVTMPRRALLVLALVDNASFISADAFTIAEMLEGTVLPRAWQVFEARVDQGRLTKVQEVVMAVPLADIPTTDKMAQAPTIMNLFGTSHSTVPTMRTGQDRRTQLVKFMIDRFNVPEMHRFAARLGRLDSELPGTNVSGSQYGNDFVDVLERHGKLSSVEFWRALAAERLQLTGEIINLAANYGVSL